MRVAVSGSTGFIGTLLVPSLAAAGHQITRLIRRPQRVAEPTLLWNPESSHWDVTPLQGIEAVIHLAGESIADGRWTRSRKDRIRESRARGTRILCEALARLPSPPQTFVSASAIGYYGDRGDEVLTEESGPGTGFLAEVCQGWEAATGPAIERGIRVVSLRIGVILSPEGGALAKMLPVFRLGLGGWLGSGRQYMSWVALDDVIRAIHHVLDAESLRGPVNVVSPHPVTNREFTKILGRTLGRPALMPVPAVALRLLLGELADEALLASARILPSKLSASGYPFALPDLEGALRRLLLREQR